MNLKGDSQLVTKVGNVEHIREMVSGLQVDGGLGTIYSDQPVSDRCVVFSFVARDLRASHTLGRSWNCDS